VVPTRTEVPDHALDALSGIGCPDRLTIGVIDSENAWHGQGSLVDSTLNALIIADSMSCDTALPS
jgi:hypothetical protein